MLTCSNDNPENLFFNVLVDRRKGVQIRSWDASVTFYSRETRI